MEELQQTAAKTEDGKLTVSKEETSEVSSKPKEETAAVSQEPKPESVEKPVEAPKP